MFKKISELYKRFFKEDTPTEEVEEKPKVERKEYWEHDEVIDALTEPFKKLEAFSELDWDDLKMFAEEMLEPEEYERFMKYLNFPI
jgi:hypothetical protein